MRAAAWLAAYRAAWSLALPPIRMLAALDRSLRAAAGKGILPRRWRVAGRLGHGDGAFAGAEPGPLWMHCASLGEAKGLWALADSLPLDLPILLTATTATGADFLLDRCADLGPGALRAARMAPLDHPGVVGAFLLRHRAIGLCLYEAELWPHYLSECRRRGLPAALVAGRLTDGGRRIYRRSGGAAARLLDGMAWIEAQSYPARERFASLTRTEVVAGYDFKAAFHLRAGREAADRDSRSAGRTGGSSAGRTRFACISLHLRELRLLLPALANLAQHGSIVVFPRHMRELRGFRALLEPIGFREHSREPEARLLLVDSLGRVGAMLPRCHSAIVGGSFIPLGCHNLWEPLLAGARVLVGPHHSLQETLVRLMAGRGLAEVVSDPDRIADAQPPGDGFPEACRGLVEELRQGLDAALRECGKRIIATFYGKDPRPRPMAPAGAAKDG
jgi:3-deoxy-D-manno-octulosonic-acid transferase